MPELRPPPAPGLHHRELMEAKAMIHDLAMNGLGEEVSKRVAGAEKLSEPAKARIGRARCIGMQRRVAI